MLLELFPFVSLYNVMAFVHIYIQFDLCILASFSLVAITVRGFQISIAYCLFLFFRYITSIRSLYRHVVCNVPVSFKANGVGN